MSSEDDALYARISAVQREYAPQLLRKANVVGVGVGVRQRGGVRTNELVLVVMVRHKVALGQLAPADRIPPEIDGVPVDVQAVGTLRAQP